MKFLLIFFSCSSKIDLEKHNVDYESRASGINYNYKSLELHPNFISSLSLQMEVIAIVNEENVSLASNSLSTELGSACCGPCDRVEHLPMNCNLTSDSADCSLRILRFYQFGQANTERGKVDWLIKMEEGDKLLSGNLITKLKDDGNLFFPSKMRLGGKMQIWLKLEKGNQIIKLASRKESILSGMANSWPPKGAELILENGPIDYYKLKDVKNPNAKPFLTITRNKVKIGNKDSNFLKAGPRLQELAFVDKNGENSNSNSKKCIGVKIKWIKRINTKKNMEISHYNLYRNYLGGNGEGWKFIAKVPASKESYIDTKYNFKQDASYAITHAMPIPLGEFYEGLNLDQPLTIKIKKENSN